MRQLVETIGYKLCWELAFRRVCRHRWWGILERLWTPLWYRYYCPRPVISPWTAKACVRSGNCGCENQKFYALPNGELK